MTQANTFIVLFYALFWPVRINGCIRRGKQPLLRGKEWFFDVPVPAGFYEGAGKRLMRDYWLRMLIPFAVDIPLATWIFLTGRLLWLNWLVIGLCALIHVNHVYSVDLAQRQARRFRAIEQEETAVVIGGQLAVRRLRDYSNAAVEWGIAIVMMGGLAVLTAFYLADPAQRDWRMVFGAPIVCVYLQLGMLLVKSFIVRWRTPVPQTHAAEHMEAREQMRAYYLKMCDWGRISFATPMLILPLGFVLSRTAMDQLLTAWLWLWMALSIAATVWVEIKRKQLVRVSLRARPVKMPGLLNEAGMARWPLCFQPSAPTMILKGARGYSLNIANALTQLSAAYLVGMAVLIAALRAAR